ncbi:MAG: hypothetical protein JWM63_2115 [Gammaproteobacteria bacterium]|nr:hypothetical protein [Gammaproteobacteria bacterium]
MKKTVMYPGVGLSVLSIAGTLLEPGHLHSHMEHPVWYQSQPAHSSFVSSASYSTSSSFSY